MTRGALLGVALFALVVAVQVAGSRLLVAGGAYALLAGAAYWALVAWGAWFGLALLRRS